MKTRWYRQEARSGIYQLTIPFLSAVWGMRKFWPVAYERAAGYWNKGLVTIFLNEAQMHKGAEFAFRKSRFAKHFQEWNRQWKKMIDAQTERCEEISRTDLTKLSDKELKSIFEEIKRNHLEIWDYSIFVDMFDAGLDKNEADRIQHKYKFNDEEAHALLTPEYPTYVAQWEEALRQYKMRKLNFLKLKQQFFWIGTDYAVFHELTPHFIQGSFKHLSRNKKQDLRKIRAAILRKHALKRNPFQFFVNLAVLRDERKRMNFTGVYAILRIMREVFRRKQIPIRLVPAVKVGEEGQCFAGKIDRRVLEKRLKGPTWFEFFADGRITITTGVLAEKRNKQNLRIDTKALAQVTEMSGTIASKGYAIGKARVILHVNSKTAHLMKKNEVLVTNMTRPEFVPLMKKASAIVTDEGGLSSHAAIVARELGVPCVIGLKHATQIFKNGDLVEVDANKGIVKVLKRKRQHARS